MRNSLCILLCIFPILKESLSQVSFSPSEEDLACSKFDSSCSQCNRNPKCHWCSKFNGKEDYHCFSRKTSLTPFCLSTIHELKSRIITIIKHKGGFKSDKPTQLTPQQFSINLSQNDPVTLEISYRQLDDYPLDLYYLMDLSKSMKPHKDTLANVGKLLADTMRGLTTRFRLGFGSFVDKVLLPYVNTHPEALKYPCGTKEHCETPFSFKNNLPLTEDDLEFKSKVDAAEISTNLDSPEGGFDGLMQAMVCKKEIGWSEHVRKIIVFSTDGQFHMAGDGKLGGVITPNDAKCHLNEHGIYDKYDRYDYPSVGQISEVSQKEGVNIIFAAKGNEKLYRELASYIEGSAYAKLDRNSENIVDLVKSVYENITGRVEIQQSSDTLDKHISVKVESNCHGDGRSFLPVNYCENVKEGNELKFRVTVEMTECPKNQRLKKIKVGTLQDMVEIEINMLCECDCEKTTSSDRSSCKDAGSVQCGVCICDEGSFGKQCQCNAKSSRTSWKSDTDKCRDTDTHGDKATVCSGRGRCECETCDCKKDYDGKFCECNQALCRHRPDAETFCSSNGVCNCGVCSCKEGWSGEFCQCLDEKACIQPGTDKKCSGNGKCDCGVCSCSQGKIPYSGEYCEECPSCDNGQCDQFRPCVQCKHFYSGVMDKEECEDNCTINIQTRQSLEAEIEKHASLCTYLDGQTNCDFSFTYKFISKNNYQIFVKEEQDCPEPINFLAVTAGVVGGVVALGILTLLIWKLLTTAHDRREYERFMKESQKMAFSGGENRLYVPATTLVANPAYKN